jgi:hypothetical protein
MHEVQIHTGTENGHDEVKSIRRENDHSLGVVVGANDEGVLKIGWEPRHDSNHHRYNKLTTGYFDGAPLLGSQGVASGKVSLKTDPDGQVHFTGL